jgi:Xaa-Pro aminopeptidase
MNELETKLERVRQLLVERRLGALLLRNVSSFAWATCGASSYINATRLDKEEKLAEQGWEIYASPWHTAPKEISSLVGNVKIGADGPLENGLDLSAEIARLRAKLTPEEGERFLSLGRQCAEIMGGAIRQVRPGMSEYQIAALLAGDSQERGVQAIVNLIATDERIFNFRHPLPTDQRMERYAMLVLCGRQAGLVASITRLVYFGSLPEDLRRKAEAVAQVDAAMILETRPGKTLGQIFARAEVAYTNAGYGGEWKLHHQGGPAAYEPREYIATPDSSDEVFVGQAYAWNPSITGVKSEDTILVGESGNTVITRIQGWPTYAVKAGDQSIERPAILEVA